MTTNFWGPVPEDEPQMLPIRSVAIHSKAVPTDMGGDVFFLLPDPLLKTYQKQKKQKKEKCSSWFPFRTHQSKRSTLKTNTNLLMFLGLGFFLGPHLLLLVSLSNPNKRGSLCLKKRDEPSALPGATSLRAQRWALPSRWAKPWIRSRGLPRNNKRKLRTRGYRGLCGMQDVRSGL